MPVQSCNPLWEYSLEIYRRPGVERCCLALQERCGLDVNIVLYAAWLAARQQRLSDEHLARLTRQVSQWRDCVIRPLRELRRQLRKEDPAVRKLRDLVKRLELQAERRQQDVMYRCYCATEPPRCAGGGLRHNFERVAELAAAACGDCPGLLADLESALTV